MIQKESDTGNPAYDGYDRWFLTPDSSSGENGNAINPNGTVPGTAYHTALALWRDDDTLVKRLGELRYNQADEGVWARFIHKGMERSGQHGFKGTYRTVQVGLDKKVETDQAGSWIYGGAISHMWGDTGYTEGHGEQKSTALSLWIWSPVWDGSILIMRLLTGIMESLKTGASASAPNTDERRCWIGTGPLNRRHS